MNEIAGMLVSALGQGFIYAPMALGVFLTFSILKTPDLTVEGSFVFGMTSCVIISIAGHPILGLIAGTLAGAAAGLCTGLLQTKLKIEPILSGILTMTGLYTVNYAILGGQSNRYLQYETKNSLGVTVNKPADTVYKMFQRAFGQNMSSSMVAFLLTMIIVVITCAVLSCIFRSIALPVSEIRRFKLWKWYACYGACLRNHRSYIFWNPFSDSAGSWRCSWFIAIPHYHSACLQS